MKEELETLVTQVKALLTECLQGWLQALSRETAWTTRPASDSWRCS